VAQPTFEELIRDPKARDRLTVPQLQQFIEKLKQQAAGLGRPKGLPDSPADFAAEFSSGTWVHARHLDFLSKKLVQLEKRQLRRLMVSMPPRHGKSLLINTYFPAWWLARHPRDQVALAGYGEQFARKWGGDVRDFIIQNNEKLNLVVSRESTAADDWSLTSGGGMLCVGVGGALTGRGANLLIIDDPIKNEQEANSQIFRDRMWDWWQATSSTRMEPHAVVVVVATRWHEDDLLGRIIANDKASWEIINLPALAEENDPLGRGIGEPLWPERWRGDDEDYQIRKATSGPYWWSALFQGHPSPPGGNVFLRDDWRFYKSVDIATIVREADQVIQVWDLAMKAKTTSDFSVGQVWARKLGDFFLIDQIRGHFDLAQIERFMKSFTMKYPRALAKLVEDAALGPALKQRLQHEVSGIIPIKVTGGIAAPSKWSRAQNVVPYHQSHNIYLPENTDGTKAQWVWDFIEECSQFDKGAHDDQVDAMTHGITYMQPGGFRDLKRAMKAEMEKSGADILSPGDIQRRWFAEKVAAVKKRADKVFNPPRRGARMW
jgi:predicted phage terminase large subunit-like protein